MKDNKIWKYKQSSGLSPYTYFPRSLEGCKGIESKGKEGVHYASGEKGVVEIIVKYGLDHAPRDLNDFPKELKEEERKSLTEISAMVCEMEEKEKAAKAKGTDGQCEYIRDMMYDTHIVLDSAEAPQRLPFCST